MVIDSVVRCVHEFQGELETDLSIRPGDIVKVTNVLSDEWYEGVLKGKSGQFPKAFVEECHDLLDVGVAIRDFIGEQDGDLTFKEGDIVIITEIVDENWMQGYVQGGKHGMFPITFIKCVSFDGTNAEFTEVTQQNNTTENQSVKVLHSFSAHSSNELSLIVGELIEILNDTDDFWCEGRNNEGKEGIFPRDFVDLPPNSISENIQAEEGEDAAEIQSIETEEDPHANDETISTGTAVAEFDYVSSVEGDLNFMKGDEIRLLKIVDENWYEGELGSEKGLFPSNFVTVLKLPEPEDEHSEVLHSSNTPVIEETKTAQIIKEGSGGKSSQFDEVPKLTKMKPSRPKLPAKKSGDESIPFCYQFKTDHQPTVIISPWKLKPGQQNVLLLTKKSLTGSDLQSYTSTSNKSPEDVRMASSQHQNLNLMVDKFKIDNADKKAFQDSINSSKRDMTSTVSCDKFDAKRFGAYETRGRTEFESINKNIPNENMNTYQKAKCVNNNLNTVVSVANVVGIKTTKTQVAKGAIKMGAATYITGSTVSKNKPSPSVKPTALKGFASKGKV